jgi:hypothetical protein
MFCIAMVGDAVCRHLGFAEGAARVFHGEDLAGPLPDHLKVKDGAPDLIYASPTGV